VHGISIYSSDNVYVTDRFNHNIQKFSSDEKFITVWSSKGSDGKFLLPLGIAIDSLDNVYVVDSQKSSIVALAKDGTFLGEMIIPETKKGQAPSILEDVEVDSLDNLYITDRGECDIKIFAAPTKIN
jgi:DNA-binding beta-propeller fold protein YncE